MRAVDEGAEISDCFIRPVARVAEKAVLQVADDDFGEGASRHIPHDLGGGGGDVAGVFGLQLRYFDTVDEGWPLGPVFGINQGDGFQKLGVARRAAFQRVLIPAVPKGPVSWAFGSIPRGRLNFEPDVTKGVLGRPEWRKVPLR